VPGRISRQCCGLRPVAGLHARQRISLGARRQTTGKRSDQPARLVEGQRALCWREALNELDVCKMLADLVPGAPMSATSPEKLNRMVVSLRALAECVPSVDATDGVYIRRVRVLIPWRTGTGGVGRP
jgi:hypothetical protein